MSNKASFTGRRREHRTRALVRLGEVVSRWLITVGGISTIAAVCAIGFFLLWVVVPLFFPAQIESPVHVEAAFEGPSPLHFAIDEDQLLAWTMSTDGQLDLFRLDTGKRILRRPLVEGQTLTAASGPGTNDDWLFAFADGSLRKGVVEWSGRFLEEKDLPAKVRALEAGHRVEHDGGLVERTRDGLFRHLTLTVTVEPPLVGVLPTQSLVRKLDHSITRENEEIRLAAVTDEGKLFAVEITQRRRPGARKPRIELGELVLPRSKGPPVRVLINGVGNNVLAVWEDGSFHRFDIKDIARPREEEIGNFLGDRTRQLAAICFLIGKTTVLSGDSRGSLHAWFGTRPSDVSTGDGIVFREAHLLPGDGKAISVLTPSTRTFLAAAGYADGTVRLFYIPSEKQLAEVTTDGQPIRAIAVAPRNDAAVALTSKGIWKWEFSPGHPEATPAMLFKPVWYEGNEKPEHVWQSGGGDASEPKLGLWPLIFGTLKATLYSVLIGVPIALLAAIYTSEFLSPHVRARVKPAIEMMASLPSVVLGFLAALVIAPFVDRVLPAFLATLVTVPLTFLLGAYLWQLLPEKLALRWSGLRILFIALALPVGGLVALQVGPLVEQLLFEGDLKRWLSGLYGGETFGRGTSGWIVLFLPICAIGAGLLMSRLVNPRLRRMSARWGRGRCAAADLVKFLGGVVLTVALATFAALLLNALGFDPRGTRMPGQSYPEVGILGTYEQRNALIVGFVMGFAIIPIIYTIAEDALSAVPDHLRSASLGCGATTWQTAIRIVLPTAMSGLFSAVMVGLGRAVGETMIVFMAAGSTPVRDWNIFNGFRTLSANIATEMPEAVRGSTHYRTLYLAGLVLFLLTFVLNTIAELVRLRFRKRAYQL